MNIIVNKKFKKSLILENVKQAKQYAASGKLSDEELKTFIERDPSKSKKYVGWMAKMWITDRNSIEDVHELSSYISEYDSFAQRNKVKTKDINQFKNYNDFKKEVDELNASGADVSNAELEKDYEIVRDDDKMIIAVPHTHEASRKLGLSTFAFRDCGDGEKDSSWCTTYKAPNHFNDYYYQQNVTFYYVKVKSKELIMKLKEAFPENYKNLIVVALAILDGGQIDAYDGLDKQLSQSNIQQYIKILGIG